MSIERFYEIKRKHDVERAARLARCKEEALKAGKEPFDPKKLIELWVPPDLVDHEPATLEKWALEQEDTYYTASKNIMTLREYAKELSEVWIWDANMAMVRGSD